MFIAVKVIELRVFKKKNFSCSKHVKLPLDLIVCIQSTLNVFSTSLGSRPSPFTCARETLRTGKLGLGGIIT